MGIGHWAHVIQGAIFFPVQSGFGGFLLDSAQQQGFVKTLRLETMVIGRKGARLPRPINDTNTSHRSCVVA